MAVAARAALVIASILAVASSTSAFADFDEPQPAAAPPTVLPLPEITTEAAPAQPGLAIGLPDECALLPTGCLEVPALPASAQTTLQSDEVPSCRLPDQHDPQGATQIVIGPTASQEANLRFRVEVEQGLAIDENCFAEAVTSILTDDRGWTANDGPRFVRVEDDSYDFRLILASPETTDRLCYPAATGGNYSCRNQEKVVVNLMRWETGTDEFSGQLDTYRRYLINHEVGHLLGHSHRACPEGGTPAPVMMQQTKGLGDCLPNGWPRQDER